MSGMQFAKSSVFSALVGSVPDVTISWLSAKYLAVGFWEVFLGLQALQFLMWAKTASWSWLWFYIYARRQITARMEDHLRQDFYPHDSLFVGDAEFYFQNILDSDSLPCALRVKAAANLGFIDALRRSGQATLLMQTLISLNGALDRYFRNGTWGYDAHGNLKGWKVSQ
jgi:hypothetical protein